MNASTVSVSPPAGVVTASRTLGLNWSAGQAPAIAGDEIRAVAPARRPARARLRPADRMKANMSDSPVCWSRPQTDAAAMAVTIDATADQRKYRVALDSIAPRYAA